MLERKNKQYGIITTYFIIFSLFIYWIYAAFLKAPETCFDKEQNQNETAIDCGGVCGACAVALPAEPLQVMEKSIVYGGPSVNDVLVKIHNPNDTYGASSFTYTTTLKDASGAVLATKKNTSFILPKETKYLVQVGLATTATPASAEIQVSDIEWQSFVGFRESPNITIGHKQYGPVPSGVGFGQVVGTLVNQSNFDFQVITVKVILRDAAGKPLAVNSTEMRTIIADERRDVGPLIFPSYFPGDVASIDMEPEADTYHSDNFIKQYLPGGDSQRL